MRSMRTRVWIWAVVLPFTQYAGCSLFSKTNTWNIYIVCIMSSEVWPNELSGVRPNFWASDPAITCSCIWSLCSSPPPNIMRVVHTRKLTFNHCSGCRQLKNLQCITIPTNRRMFLFSRKKTWISLMLHSVLHKEGCIQKRFDLIIAVHIF